MRSRLTAAWSLAWYRRVSGYVPRIATGVVVWTGAPDYGLGVDALCQSIIDCGDGRCPGSCRGTTITRSARGISRLAALGKSSSRYGQAARVSGLNLARRVCRCYLL